MQPFLADSGYTLRSRFQPNWVPSWKVGEAVRCMFWPEDTCCLKNPSLMDAERSDGTQVFLKYIGRYCGSQEIEILQRLSEPNLLNDPRNHCVPLLGILYPPMLLNVRYPEFSSIVEGVDLIHQLLEGKVFLHEHNIAHRDCCMGNIAADSQELYPFGCRPQCNIYNADYTWRSHPRKRSEIRIKYVYIDFGLSAWYASKDDRKLELAPWGQNKAPPELSRDIPYDGFMLDIYCLGDLVRKEWLEKWRNMEFLRPLVVAMTRQNPSERPTAEQAFALFETIRSQLSRRFLAKRLKRLDGYTPSPKSPSTHTSDSTAAKAGRQQTKSAEFAAL
ncbi:hypothetical protein BD410DRAFT_810883 [Rickenella mellea]|uniref:Protein kinase domain-containing protein n=1 Tax=Rickenella mellea TaxID=50990 RepID=A0A4R5XDH5_9AGAM|nr:hypothetical protein BD410DRAFT_810883 [Rickenella mellea]